MSDYRTLETRLAGNEVVILDGAVGTQLQKMGVPMNSHAWAATALQTHPYTVRLLHENYIRAGVDIITVNSYSAARHNLVPLGLEDLTRELNLRAVVLAREARDRCAKERPFARSSNTLRPHARSFTFQQGPVTASKRRTITST